MLGSGPVFLRAVGRIYRVGSRDGGIRMPINVKADGSKITGMYQPRSAIRPGRSSHWRPCSTKPETTGIGRLPCDLASGFVISAAVRAMHRRDLPGVRKDGRAKT